jgi:hypothetical protein
MMVLMALVTTFATSPLVALANRLSVRAAPERARLRSTS